VELKRYRDKNISIVYDGALGLDCPQRLFVDANAGESVSDAGDTVTRRGRARFFKHKQMPMVLKHYHRGGLVGHLIRDTYLLSLLGFSRMKSEFTLLVKLRKLALPVPEPVAFRQIRTSLFTYRGDLITRRIPGALTLTARLREAALGPQVWQDIGATIARFHARQVYHADLNASNILIDCNDNVHLIDFDKGAIRPANGERWKSGNLQRLRRSLDKLAGLDTLHFSDSDWQALLCGYAREGVLSRH